MIRSNKLKTRSKEVNYNMDTISKLIWETILETKFNIDITSIPSNKTLDKIVEQAFKKIIEGGDLLQ